MTSQPPYNKAHSKDERKTTRQSSSFLSSTRSFCHFYYELQSFLFFPGSSSLPTSHKSPQDRRTIRYNRGQFNFVIKCRWFTQQFPESARSYLNAQWKRTRTRPLNLSFGGRLEQRLPSLFVMTGGLGGCERKLGDERKSETSLEKWQNHPDCSLKDVKDRMCARGMINSTYFHVEGRFYADSGKQVLKPFFTYSE